MAKTVLDRLDKALAAHYPKVRAALGRPATSASLHCLWLEQTPALLRALYTRWDGGGALYGDYRFLTLRQGATRATLQHALWRRNAVWQEKGFWNKKWIPFLRARDNSIYCVDLAGAFGGPLGQILLWDAKGGPTVAFANLESLLETFCVLAEKDVLIGHEAAADTLYKKHNPGFPHKGTGQAKPLEDEFSELSAARSYKKLIARTVAESTKNPKLAVPWKFRARALELLDRPEEAIAAHDQLLKLDKAKYANSHLRKALLRIGRATFGSRHVVKPPKGKLNLVTAEREIEAFLATKPVEYYEHDEAVDAYATLATENESRGRIDEMFRLFAIWKPLAKRLDRGDPKRFNFHMWHDYAIHLEGKARRRAFETALAGTRARITAERAERKALPPKVKEDIAQLDYYAVIFCTHLGLWKEAVEHIRAAMRFDRDYLDFMRKQPELKPLFARSKVDLGADLDDLRRR